MTKNEFIKELKIKLKKLPSQELNDALSYYMEYFEDAGIDDNADVSNEFGSPSTVASQILSDYAVKDTQLNNKSKKNQISSVWFIILAILASPIALPLTFAMIIVTFALVVSIGAIVFAFTVTSLSIAFSGLIVFGCGISFIVTEFSSAILFMGIGLILLGLGLLAFVGILVVSNKLLKVIVFLISKLLNKINAKEQI